MIQTFKTKFPTPSLTPSSSNCSSFKWLSYLGHWSSLLEVPIQIALEIKTEFLLKTDGKIPEESKSLTQPYLRGIYPLSKQLSPIGLNTVLAVYLSKHMHNKVTSTELTQAHMSTDRAHHCLRLLFCACYSVFPTILLSGCCYIHCVCEEMEPPRVEIIWVQNVLFVKPS